jgi:hypothetical protein
MKTNVLTVLFISLFSILNTGTTAEAQVHVSVYVNIPLAPDIVLSVGTPAIQAPAPDYIWIDGYWSWSSRHRNYVWVQGYWALAPYADAYWIPGYWEYYRSGYRWVEAGWIPGAAQIHFGYGSRRYDYYGRPVYYHPYNPREYRNGYAYSYDHNPGHRGKGYNSSPYFNSSPGKERDAINKKNDNPRQAPTTRNPTRTGSSRSSGRTESSGNNLQGKDNPNPRPTGERTPQTTTRTRENTGESTRTSQPAAVSSGSRESTRTSQPANANASSRNGTGERSSAAPSRTNTRDASNTSRSSSRQN